MLGIEPDGIVVRPASLALLALCLCDREGYAFHIAFEFALVGALGDLNMSCGAQYITHDDHPEFSLGVHLYLRRDGEAVRLEKATFTLYYNEEDENGYLTVYPVDTAGGKGDSDVMRVVFRRVAGYDFPGFQREYPIR